MRNLEDIDRDLAAAREALAHVEGTPAEVYSRIVGYYRSVRNWNKGKREEYGERRLYTASTPAGGAVPPGPSLRQGADDLSDNRALRLRPLERSMAKVADTAGKEEPRILLFMRPTCPACPSVKDAATRLGVPVDLVNADTEAGLAEAARRNVMSTPTAILLTGDGRELGRARDSTHIADFGKLMAG
jgi:ribonucleoside-triphosphate reductase